MQIKDQIKGREWKVVAAVTTVGALGFSGLALAGPGNNTPANPGSIDLRDRSDVTSTSLNTGSTDFTFPSYGFSHSADTSSPFTDSPSPSPDTPSPSPDSPSPSPDSPSSDAWSDSSDSPSSADS